MRILNTTLKAYSTARQALWIGVPLSLTIGVATYMATSRSIAHDASNRFTGHAQNASNTIAARIKSYTDVLRGASSVFQISDYLTREQFHGYVEGLDLARNFPAVENVNYAHNFLDSERDRFEARIRSERLNNGASLSGFAINPPGRRDMYSVAVYIEPEGRFDNTLGYDMYSKPAVRAQSEKMRDENLMVTTGMPIALTSSPTSTVLGLRTAVYRTNMPHKTIDERKAASVGSVGIAFSLHRLVNGVLDEIPITRVRMTLVDHKTGKLLLDSGAAPEAARSPVARLFNGRLFDARLVRTEHIDFHGRQWDATFSVNQSDLHSHFEMIAPWLAALAGTLSTMLMYALYHSLASSRRRAIKLARGMTRELRDSQAKLQLSHQNLRRLAAHSDQIKEGERKRIAREIHDDLGQNLLALRIEADMLSARTSDRHPRLHARALATLKQIDVTIKSVRQIINDLRPNVLDLGLSAAVEWQVSEFTRRTGIACELVDEPTEVTLSDNAATAFFRILQESLSNIVRHANATRIRIELKASGNRLAMTISDNGIGLHSRERHKSGSFGLVGIEERINILGGAFSITSASGKGTTVCVSVPLGRPGDGPDLAQPTILRDSLSAIV